MAEKKSQPGESPEENGAREDAEAQARAAAEAKAKAAEEAAGAETVKTGAAAKKETAVIRHKTQYPKYRCASLILTQKPEAYRVTEAQLEKLRRDPWVVIEKEPEQK
jgi:hypothetical protein